MKDLHSDRAATPYASLAEGVYISSEQNRQYTLICVTLGKVNSFESKTKQKKKREKKRRRKQRKRKRMLKKKKRKRRLLG